MEVWKLGYIKKKQCRHPLCSLLLSIIMSFWWGGAEPGNKSIYPQIWIFVKYLLMQMVMCFTCQTPTMAFAIRISRMTKGSTKAVTVSSPSSNQASTCTTETGNPSINTIYTVLRDQYVQEQMSLRLWVYSHHHCVIFLHLNVMDYRYFLKHCSL